MTRTVTLVAIVVAAGSALAGSALTGGWPLALLALSAGAVWLADQRGGRHRLASPLLAAFVILAAANVGLPAGRVLGPLTVVAALAAWDLDRFAARLDQAGGTIDGQQAERRRLEAQHLRRLLLVAAVGLALAWFGEALRVRVPFGWAVGLGLLVALGLAGLVRALVSESD